MSSPRRGVAMDRRSLVKTLIASGSVTALAGCSGGDGASLSSSGTLEVASADDPDNLDPHTTTINVAQLALENVMEGLFELSDELEVVPLLASDYQVSDDNLEYEVELKEGVMFHEPVGGELTAQDVEYTIDRILDPDLGSPRASNFAMLDTLEIVDDYTVRFVLSEPFAPFLWALTEGSGIVPTDAEEEVDLQQEPVGTGPFSYGEWRVDEILRLDAFDDYHRDGQPILDEVAFNVVPEASTRRTQLSTGDAHVMFGVQFQNAEQIESGSDTDLLSVPSIWKQSLFINTNEGPLGEPAVRRAIDYAIDREELVQGVLFERGAAMHSPVPPTSRWDELMDTREPRTADQERAEELLSDAGYQPSDIDLTIKASRTPGPTYADTATLLQSQLSDLGMDVEIDVMDFSTWLQEVWESNDFEVSVGSWSGRIDPDGWYYRQYHSEGAWNFWGYENDEVDSLLEEGRTTIGTEDRADIYSQVDQLVAEEPPILYLYARDDMTGIRTNVEGYDLSPAKQASFHDTSVE